MAMEASLYPLLCELAGTLVLGVTEQLDHTLLVGSEAVELNMISKNFFDVWQSRAQRKAMEKLTQRPP